MTPLRNLERERGITIEAAGVNAIPCDGLIDFAELRSRAPEGVRDIDTRDFGLEVREEAADARNYYCWWWEQIVRRYERKPDFDLRPVRIRLARGVAATAIAFDVTHQVEPLVAAGRRS